MFNKFQVAGFSALNLIVATASAQSILDHTPQPSKPAAAVAAVLKAVTAPTPAPVAAPAAVAPEPAPEPKVTIQDLASKQAKAMAAESNKKVGGGLPGTPGTPPAGPLVVGELAPAAPIPVTMTPNFKPLMASAPPPPPRPYFAALIGFKGQEIAEINIGNGISTPFKVGDSIKDWKITGVIDGRLILVSTSTKRSKKKKTAPVVTERVLSVGEYL